MLAIKRIQTVAISGILLAFFGCQQDDSYELLSLAETRGVAPPPSGRDAGISQSAVPFIDTGIASETESSDFIPGERCADDRRRSCTAECGGQRCVNGEWTGCSAETEICNGRDDDCDGTADETFGVGTGCSNRQPNGCLAQGVLQCDSDESGVRCDVDLMTPSTEICDGVDNDCDGQSDEDFPEQRCCVNDYVCPPGGECIAGQCQGGPRSDAATGEANGDPGAGQGEPCQSPFDCRFGLVCAMDTCEPICFSTDDCSPGLACGCSVDRPSCFLTACLDPNNVAPSDPESQPNDDSPADVDGQRVGGVSCRDAIELDQFGEYLDSTADAVNEIASTCGTPTGGQEKVFVFSLQDETEVILDTTGSSFDTVMAVRTQCDEIATEILCDDDGAGNLQARLQFVANPATRYYVVVQGYRAELSGDITLRFTQAQ
jgi:hypothetical protein